jgi:DNA sulfur modification protein DndE
MLINLRTSEANKAVVQELTKKMNLGSENYVSRIAFSYSISKDIILSIERDLKDSKGKEYKDDILFGKYRNYYISIVCQHYNLHSADPNIGKYIKMHIDNGLELIYKLFENNKNYTGLDFLIENIEKGISGMDEVSFNQEHVKNNNQAITKTHYGGLIKILIGKDLTNDEPIYFNLNDLKTHSNAHVAIAGNSGTGKTYFANSFLQQIVDESKGNVNFVYLDFKGLKKEDEKNLKPFFDKTKASYIDLPHTQFPINPLSFIDNVNEKNKIMGINKFVDILTHYGNLGKIQQQTLKDATRIAFENKKGGLYPSLKEIYTEAINLEGTKPSSLSKILLGLTEVDLFDNNIGNKNNFLNSNVYLSLSGDLNDDVRFTSLFLIINYIYNTFMNMSNAPIEDNIQSMRYVLLIDEAHVIFKQKKSQELLERILREIRSKGVSVVLLSQGIEEFNQPSFDFSTMCETAILFDIKDKSNLKMMAKFMGLGEKESQKLKASMEKIDKYQAVSNLKEFKAGELFSTKI